MEQRTILFRGKRLDNGEWVYGGYFKHDTVKVCFTSDDPKTKHCIVFDGSCDWGFEPPLQYCEVDPKTVGQYTGIHDDNGRPIFEGDTVRATYIDGGRKIQGVVNYFYDGFCARHDEHTNPTLDTLWFLEIVEE